AHARVAHLRAGERDDAQGERHRLQQRRHPERARAPPARLAGERRGGGEPQDRAGAPLAPLPEQKQRDQQEQPEQLRVMEEVGRHRWEAWRQGAWRKEWGERAAPWRRWWSAPPGTPTPSRACTRRWWRGSARTSPGRTRGRGARASRSPARACAGG